ncbi:MAG: hypothetical protein KAS77_08395, partial [Thermoplasmata archaeon]|nr:hypothetical protein [Thermoplasmata archaeon]
VTAVSTETGYLLARNITVPFQIDNVDVRVPSIPTFIDPNCGDVMRGELSITPGTDMSFKIKVENNGTLPTGPVLVRVFDNYVVDGRQVRWNFFNFTTPSIAVGDRYIVGERPFTPSNPPLFWPTDVSADHHLEFRVFLDHQSNTENDVAYFNVSVQAKYPHPDDRDRSPPPYLDIWIFTMVLVAIHITIAAVLMMPPARLRYRRLWRDRWSRR